MSVESHGPPGIVYRGYRDEDLDALAGLWLESWRSIGLVLDRDPTLAQLRARILRDVADRWRVTLAVEGERLVGFLALKVDEGLLDQLFIAPAAKGRGVGSALLDLARREIPQGLWLSADAANVRARAFYERRGLRLDRYEADPVTGRPDAVYVWP